MVGMESLGSVVVVGGQDESGQNMLQVLRMLKLWRKP